MKLVARGMGYGRIISCSGYGKGVIGSVSNAVVILYYDTLSLITKIITVVSKL